MLVRILVSAALLIGFGFLPLTGAPRFFCYVIPYLVIGYDILIKAFKGIKNRQPFDESLLMVAATIGAFVIAVYDSARGGSAGTLAGHEGGDYTEAVAVMLFYQVGEWFQSYAVGRSRRNISDLMDIRPDYANIETGGGLEQIDPDEVEIGSVIVVQPGEKVPIDGTILEGNSSLNTSALTGESLPREASEGDEVLSGCINMTGVLKIRTTKEFGESTVSKILDLVENASSRKSKSEEFITKFARIYTPAVVYSAIALAVLPPLVRMMGMGLAAQAPVGSAGVSILPFGNGAERMLENKETGCSICGVNFNLHGKQHIVRAAQEGIVFSFKYGIDIMEQMGIPVQKIHAGHANMFLSPIFRETLAGVTGAVIELYDTDGSVGAAKGAGIGAGVYKDNNEAFATLEKLEVIEPDVAQRTAYDDAYARWKSNLERAMAAF